MDDFIDLYFFPYSIVEMPILKDPTILEVLGYILNEKKNVALVKKEI